MNPQYQFFQTNNSQCGNSSAHQAPLLFPHTFGTIYMASASGHNGYPTPWINIGPQFQ